MSAHNITLRAYDPDWPEHAASESQRLASALGDNLVVTHHIGSTAVVGLRAKPTIDLMPVVCDLKRADEQRSKIEALGYEWRGPAVFENARFCVLPDQDGWPLFHLHICPQGHREVDRHVRFRDFLRAHPEEARAYELEKERARALHPQNSIAYSAEKSAWIAAADARTASWVAAQK